MAVLNIGEFGHETVNQHVVITIDVDALNLFDFIMQF